MGKLAIYELQRTPGALAIGAGPGGLAPGVLVGELSTEEPRHLQTWLEVQLAAAGRAAGAAEGNAYLCRFQELEALARDFLICSGDASLRQNTAREALDILSRQPEAARHRRGLLELALAWGHVEAEPLLLAELAQAGDFASARELLRTATLSPPERALAEAELALLEGDLPTTARCADRYFDEIHGQAEVAPAQLQAVAGVLEVCAAQPELRFLLQHPLVAAHRAALQALTEDEALRRDLQSELRRWLAEHRVKLAVALVGVTAVIGLRDLLLPVLFTLLVPAGLLGLVVAMLKRRRSRKLK